MKKVFAILALVVLTWLDAGAKSGPQHVNDLIDCVFNSEKTPVTRDLSRYISQGMDMGSGAKPLEFGEQGSSFLNTIRQDMGGGLRGFGEHRELGHWAFDGSIPKSYFDKLDELIKAGKIPENSIELFRARWQEFVMSRTEAVKQVFGISGPNSDRAARSFASMMNDVHCLGDYTTKATKGLRPIDDIWRNYCTSANRILGRNNNLIKQVKLEIKGLPKNLPDDVRAAKILEILKSHNADLFARIENVFGQMGYKGILHPVDYSKIKGLLAKWRQGTILKNADALIKKGYKAVSRFVVRNGKKVQVLDIPVVIKEKVVIPAEEYMKRSKACAKEAKALFSATAKKMGLPAAKGVVVVGVKNVSKWLETSAGQGCAAGILTFVIDESSAVMEFSSGDMARDQFVQKTVFNVGKATAMGAATYGVVALSSAAAAPALVTAGAVIATGILIEKGGKYVWVEIEKESGVLPGLTEDDLLYALPPCIFNRDVWMNKVESGVYQTSPKENREMFDNPDRKPIQRGRSFY